VRRLLVAPSLCLFVAVSFFRPAPAAAEIYTVYSDVGFPNVPPDLVFTGSQGIPAVFDGQSTDCPQPPPEGVTSFKTVEAGRFTNTFWGLVYHDASGQNQKRDLSRFSTGELRFWIYTSTGNIDVQIKRATPLFST